MLYWYRKLYNTYMLKLKVLIDISKDREEKFDASNYKDTERPLAMGKNEKVLVLVKDKLGGEQRENLLD